MRWDITGMCNLKCLHCYNKLKPEPDLPVSDVLNILRILLVNDLRELNLSGREPTMRRDLPQIINWCRMHNVRVNLTTNGTLLDQSKLERFASSINMMVYSLDGPRAAIHDNIRGHGNFRKTITSIEKCGDYVTKNNIEMQVGVSCTLHRHNFREISDMINLCDSFGVSFLSINPISFCGSTLPMKEMLYLDPKEIMDSWDNLCRRYHGIRPMYDLHLGTFPMEARLLNMKYDLDLPVIQNNCSAGRSLYINPGGEAFPCYMIPPIAEVLPEFTKYLNSWKILTEPISKAEFAFRPFIALAQAHSQNSHECCTDCSENPNCQPCPLIAMYDTASVARCQIARKKVKLMMARINKSAIPMIKKHIKWNISSTKIKTCMRKGDYMSEKEFQINPIAKFVWDKIDGTRTITDITEELTTKLEHLPSDEISSIVVDLVNYLRKEGIVQIKCNE